MATPGQLVAKVQGVFRLPANAVVYPWRVLREAGLVTTGGRGMHAAQVTPRDAALLLIAVAGDLPAQDLLTSVQRFTELPTRGDLDSKDPSKKLGIFQDLPADHTFLDALTQLCASAADGSLSQALRQRREAAIAERRVSTGVHMEVRFLGPLPQASFRFVGDGADEHVIYSPIPNEVKEIMEWASDAPTDESDLWQFRYFGAKTLLAIGELLGAAK